MGVMRSRSQGKRRERSKDPYADRQQHENRLVCHHHVVVSALAEWNRVSLRTFSPQVAGTCILSFWQPKSCRPKIIQRRGASKQDRSIIGSAARRSWGRDDANVDLPWSNSLANAIGRPTSSPRAAWLARPRNPAPAAGPVAGRARSTRPELKGLGPAKGAAEEA